MILASDYLGITISTRDALAFWSDIFGIAGFVFSSAGLFVALMVNRRIREVKSQARAVQRMAAIDRFAGDIANAKHALELAREACYSKRWDRAKTYFDIAIGQAVRLSAMRDFPNGLRQHLIERVEEIRESSKWMVNRSSAANLSVGRQAILDQLIEKLVELNSNLRSVSEDNIP